MVPGGDLATTFAVGEEGGSDQAAGRAAHRDVTPISAPLNRVDAAVRRGDTARVDVVVRTRKIGHFFPGGTVDAFDVWVELQAVDDKGQVIFWSGAVADGGKGPVDPGAHFYKSLQIDQHGNVINKRNAWSTRATVYVRLIPPGAADTVHYRLKIPEGAGDRITLTAKLHYRKFQWWNTQFAYAGVPDPAVPAEVQKAFDDRPFIFSGQTRTVSGELKYVPDLPIVTIAENEASLRVLPKDAPEPERRVALDAKEWTRWNDYGIGLLLQGDLKAAETAFTRVTEMAPRNPDGWVNIGRVRVQEGNVAGARDVLEKALQLAPDLARANYFFSRVLKAEGKLEESGNYLRKVLAQYPKDRVGTERPRPRAVPAAPVSRGGQGVRDDARDRPGGSDGALQPDALLQRPRPERAREGTPGAVPALQDRRIVSGHHGPVPAEAPGRQQRAPDHPRARVGGARHPEAAGAVSSRGTPDAQPGRRFRRPTW